jgi:hypothetical protein
MRMAIFIRSPKPINILPVQSTPCRFPR